MKFKTRKNAGLAIQLTLVFLAAAAILSFYFCIVLSIPEFTSMSIVLGVSGLIWTLSFAAVYLQSYAWYTYYKLLEEGIFLRGVYSKRMLGYGSIDRSAILEPTEAAATVEKYQHAITQEEQEGNLSSWYRSNKKYGEMLRFSTVQFIHSRTSVGHERNIKRSKTYKAGRFVMMVLADGQIYLLSPADPERFVVAFEAKLKSSW